MKEFQLVLLLCVSSICYSLAEESVDEANTATESSEKIVLQKSEAYNRRISSETPSFLSKLKSWIFPFGDSDNAPKYIDSVPAAIEHPLPIYSLPSSQTYKPNCNSCNKEPWIPVATNYGQNTIIGFVQPSNIGGTYPAVEYLQPPPSGQYGVPNINTNYGPPNNGQYVLPAINTNYGPPKEQYFASNDLSISYKSPLASNEINQNLGPPPPLEVYPTPPQTYGPALPQIPAQNVITPVNINYGPPIDIAPSKNVDGLISNLNYADLISPKPIEVLASNTNYIHPVGSAPFKSPAIPPVVNYNQPAVLNNIPQRPGKSYGAPPRRPNSHGPLNYPPIPKNYMSAPPAVHQPKHLQSPPRFIQKPNGKARPPHKDYGPPFFIPNMKPPLASSFVTNYGVPLNQFPIAPTAQYGAPNNINTNIISTVISAEALPSVVPSDSYGAPVTGSDFNYGIPTQSGREYLPPRNGNVHISQSIPLSEFDEVFEVPKAPIPFPNLNQLPLTPIHNAKDFHLNNFNIDVGGEYQESRHREVYNSNQIVNTGHNKGATDIEIQNSHQVYSTQVGETQNKHPSLVHNINNPLSTVHVQNGQIHHLNNVDQSITLAKQKEIASDIQILQSIPVANFLSTIEHPISLIQSPLVEVTASEHNADQEVGEQKSYSSKPVKLSDHPIIVEPSNYDNHASASAANVTYQSNYKRGNDVHLGIPQSINEIKATAPNPHFLNHFLQAGLGETSSKSDLNKTSPINLEPVKFTPPPLDYTSWSPSSNFVTTSMVPPPPGSSVWVAALGNGGEIVTTTTKTPKQIQIVIPYTSHGNSNGKTQTLKGKKTTPYDYVGPKLSLYTQPPTSESVWLKYTDTYHAEEYNTISSPVYTQKPNVINIKDLLKKEEDKKILQNLAFDMADLQKNIDSWTEEEYSRKLNRGLTPFAKLNTPSFPLSPKNIPTSLFSTNSYNATDSTPLKYTRDFYDHEPAGSSNKESKFNEIEHFDSNFVITETSTLPTTTEEYSTVEYPVGKTDLKGETTSTPASWQKQVSFSDLTKEKIYVVTPQSLTRVTTPSPMVSFSHPPRIGGKSASEIKDEFNNGLKLILSEWPHLINNLETTTTQRPTSPHPLFGLMDLSPYIPPPNSTIQTYAGHSKVITIVTPITFISRKVEDSFLESSTEPTKKS